MGWSLSAAGAGVGMAAGDAPADHVGNPDGFYQIAGRELDATLTVRIIAYPDGDASFEMLHKDFT